MEQVLEALNGDLQEDQRSESYEDDFENDTPVKSVPEDARSDIAGWGDHDDSQSQVSVVPTGGHADQSHTHVVARFRRQAFWSLVCTMCRVPYTLFVSCTMCSVIRYDLQIECYNISLALAFLRTLLSNTAVRRNVRSVSACN